jgi:ribosome-associated protein
VGADAVPDELDEGGAPDEPRSWAMSAARAAAGMTDEDTTVLEVGPVLGIVGYFVITAGRNGRQVKALAEEVEHRVAEAGGPRPLRIEGLDALEWVLVDYGDFVVHVFSVETRRFYDLERLWRDVPRVDWGPEPV